MALEGGVGGLKVWGATLKPELSEHRPCWSKCEGPVVTVLTFPGLHLYPGEFYKPLFLVPLYKRFLKVQIVLHTPGHAASLEREFQFQDINGMSWRVEARKGAEHTHAEGDGSPVPVRSPGAPVHGKGSGQSRGLHFMKQGAVLELLIFLWGSTCVTTPVFCTLDVER